MNHEEPARVADSIRIPATPPSISTLKALQIPDKRVEYKETTWRLAHPLPPIAKSFARAAEAAGVPYIGQCTSSDSVGNETQVGECGEDHAIGSSSENGGGAERLPLPRQLEQYFDSSFATAPRTRELWEKGSCVVGMHPDEATEDIVDLSLEHGKAFAIVPCCVFPEMNRHRRMPDGSPVRSWEQFLQYLEAKDEGIRRQTLPFPGRNVVLYHMGIGVTQGAVIDSCESGLDRLSIEQVRPLQESCKSERERER